MSQAPDHWLGAWASHHLISEREVGIIANVRAGNGALMGVVYGAYNTRMAQRCGQCAGKSWGYRVPGLIAERSCHPTSWPTGLRQEDEKEQEWLVEALQLSGTMGSLRTHNGFKNSSAILWHSSHKKRNSPRILHDINDRLLIDNRSCNLRLS